MDAAADHAAPALQSVVLDVIMDLDDCLYSRSSGIADTVRENIIGVRGSVPGLPLLPPSRGAAYMRDVLHVPADEVTELCLSTYQSHGTTFAGLVVCSLSSSTPPSPVPVTHCLL